MAKGSLAKEQIIKKILETFEGSFVNDKEVRIPVLENGEEVQIKCTFTCAKVNIDAGASANINATSTPASTAKIEITEEEKQQVVDLMKKLNL